MRTLISAICAMFGLAAPLAAGDWTQFRGSNGLGSSAETGLPAKWTYSKDKSENIRWVAELPGRGLSGVVVAGGRAYVTACDGPEQRRLIVLCFDAASGKKLWQRSVLATGGTGCHPKTSMAAPTPVTDGKNIYALFATADLVAYDADGNLLWYRSLTGDYPAITNQVGMAASPVLAPGLLVVPMDNSGESFLAGIDLKTGQNRWKAPRPRDINWVTPIVRGNEVLFQGADELVAYDLNSGARTWGYAEGKLSTIPSPTLGEKGEVLVSGGELVALKPGAAGETPAVAWKSAKLRASGYSTPLYYQGKVFSLNGTGVMQCADAKNGKLIWDVRLKGPISASPIAGDGRIYVVNEKGQTQVIKVGDKEGVIESTNEVGDEILATPAIADGAIFLRSDKHLFCIGAKNNR